MRKTTVIVAAGLILTLVVLLAVFRLYTLELIHTVVLNAVIQKAPREYPEQKIREGFARARDRATQRDQEKQYLAQLLTVSQRLEKVQQLSTHELEQLLVTLDPIDDGAHKNICCAKIAVCAVLAVKVRSRKIAVCNVA